MTNSKTKVKEAMLWQAYGEYLAMTQPWRYVRVLAKGLKMCPEEQIEFEAWKAKFLKSDKNDKQ